MESLNSKAWNENYKYERLYRNLYNPEFYLVAYQRIQAKPGNMTPGADNKTIDGMSLKRINTIIDNIKDHSYQPTPVKRTYIPKSNGKKRPLGVPSFDDKLLQEVIRLILESIYEPTFSKQSHGFRPNKSCHTALTYVQRNFTGTKWFIEGDIRGCFDTIDHHILMRILRKRIADERFLDLLWKFLRAGYMENWIYHNTYSGTPQGSIISPILANIFLNELDGYIVKYAKQFNQGKHRKISLENNKIRGRLHRLRRYFKKNKAAMTPEQKDCFIATIKELQRNIRLIQCSDPMDNEFKRVYYVRYADDFLIGVIGNKNDAELIKRDVGDFIREQLCLEMSDEKTLITHGHDFARFLGYNVAIYKGNFNKRSTKGYTSRTNNGIIQLYVPHDKWFKRLLSYGALKIKYDKCRGNKEIWKPNRRPYLFHLDDLEILNQYNAEIRGLYNFYRLANNASVLTNFGYVMRYSMLKTYAGKYQTRISKILRKYRFGKDFAVEYPKRDGMGREIFYNKGFCRDTQLRSGNPDIIAKVFENYGRNSLIKRLRAEKCENCGLENVPIEVHHIRKLKDLSGKKGWEIAMLGRRRKTLTLCVSCHDKLHAGKLD